MVSFMYYKKILLFMLFFISIFFSKSVSAEKLVLACSPSPPFVGDNLPGQGILSQIVTEAGKKVGLDISIQTMPWKRVIVMAKSGALDGIVCPVVTEERRAWLAYTEQDFFQSELGFFTHKDRPLFWKTPKDLKHKRIATLTTSAYLADLQSLEGIFITEYNNLSTGLKMLVADRFDTLYAAKNASFYILRTQHPELASQIIYSATFKKVSHRPAFSRKHPKATEFAKKLSTGYRLIQADGTLDTIIEKLDLN